MQAMKTTVPDLPNDLLALQKLIVGYEKENQLLREQIRLLYARIYGKKSEKGDPSAGVQLSLFDMPEPEVETKAETREVAAHQRQKPGRKPLPAELPRVEVVHDILCGRQKNWFFSGTPEGAQASALLYSLIETAKANALEPYKYLRYLFERLPFATTVEEYSDLLPMNLRVEDLALGCGVTGV